MIAGVLFLYQFTRILFTIVVSIGFSEFIDFVRGLLQSAYGNVWKSAYQFNSYEFASSYFISLLLSVRKSLYQVSRYRHTLNDVDSDHELGNCIHDTFCDEKINKCLNRILIWC